MPIFDGTYYYPIDVDSLNGETPYNPPINVWQHYEHDGNQSNAIGLADGDWFTITNDRGVGSRGYENGWSVLIFTDFGVRLGGNLTIQINNRGKLKDSGAAVDSLMGSNDSDAWMDPDHASWVDLGITSIMPEGWANFAWRAANPPVVAVGTPYRYFLWRRTGYGFDGDGNSIDFQAFRIGPTVVINGIIYYAVHPPVGGGAGEGLPPQGLDYDANGDALYAALYDSSNNPILVKVGLPLFVETSGTGVYVPGDGTAINIQTSKYVGGFFATSGHFGNNVQVQQSDDGGDTLTQIDPGTWAANRAQPVVVDPNDEGHILVALHTLDDLMEYTGSGTSWTTLDAALAFDVGAMAMYDLNPDEIFIGRDAAGADVILYSPNNGVGGWEDITLLMTSPGAIASIEVV